MTVTEITHDWQKDPDIAQAVKGDTGSSNVLLTEDSDAKALLWEQVLLLREIVLHLRSMTDEEFTECDLKE
jgi:hypothetical protein